MADLVLIYGSEDKNIAKKLVKHLETRWSVWWDEYIKERFAEEINQEIQSASCVIVLWSKTSIKKDTVRDDVQLAKDHKVCIVGVTLDDSKPAYGFGGYSSTSFSSWDGKADHQKYEALFSRLLSVLPSPQAPDRPINIANGRLQLPTLFLSVSSFETQLVPDQAVKALTIAKAPAILVSAWDLVERREPASLISELRAFRETGGFVLLDSGNYESSRLMMHEWEPEDLAQALRHDLHDWVFCFDKLAHFNFDKDTTPEGISDKIVNMAKRDQGFTNAPDRKSVV